MYLNDYESQRRGGRGKSATKMKDEDFIEKLLVANTHDHILCFSTRGRLYWLKVYQLPLASRNARGRPIVNILPLEENERIAVNLNDGDELIGVDITHGDDDIMLFSDAGKVVRFNEKQREAETGNVKLDPETGEELLALRPMGRTATGVRGIRLKDGQKVISLIVPKGDGAILTATENGFGKRTPVADYPAKSRATQGVVSIKVSERNGKVVGAVQVNESDEIMLISDQGTLVRTHVEEVSTVGRNTQGVRLIRTIEGEHVVGLQRIDEIEVPEGELIEGEEAEEEDVAEAVEEEVIEASAVESTDDISDDNAEENKDE